MNIDFKYIFTFDEISEMFDSEIDITDLNEEFTIKHSTIVDTIVTVGLFTIPFGIMALNKYIYNKQKKKTIAALLGKETDPVKKERLSTQLDLATKAELKQLEILQKAKEEGKEKLKTLTPEEKKEVEAKAVAFKEKLKSIQNRTVSVQVSP